MVAKIETAAGFRIIDRSSTPLSPTDADRQFIREAPQVLQAAREQAAGHPNPEEGHQGAEVPSSMLGTSLVRSSMPIAIAIGLATT